MENMDEIIEKKRKLVYENGQGESKEKDLLTLMIESEMKSEGESLSNEELRVSEEDESRGETDLIFIEQSLYFLFSRS